MSQITEYLYASDSIASLDQAVLVLPEIYGLKPFAKQLADRCGSELFMTGYALDYFYALTGTANDFDYQAGAERGIELMRQMTGEKFIELLNQAIETIHERQPGLKHLVVIGFCFGGRLAYLSGANHTVTGIASFYGAGSNEPNFYEGYSAIESLANNRRNTTHLRVMGLFGTHDDSIPAADRQAIASKLAAAGIPTLIKEYDAGHAFFNADRADRYNQAAAEQAWQDFKNWLLS